jgi:hypothetical protein
MPPLLAQFRRLRPLINAAMLVSLTLPVLVGAGLVAEPAAALATEGANDSSAGEAWLRHAEWAVEQRDWHEADESFRVAWGYAQTRQRAVVGLEHLHATPGFVLPAEEPAVEDNQRLLGAGFVRSETDHFVLLSDCDAEWTAARGRLLERTRQQFFRTAARLNIPAIPHEHKLLVVLFDDQGRYQHFARVHDGLESSWVAGYYSTRGNRAVFFNDASSPAFGGVLAGLKAGSSPRGVSLAQADAEAPSDRMHPAAGDTEAQAQRERLRIQGQAAEFSTAKTIHEAVHLLSFNTGMQSPSRDYPFWLSEGMATSFETGSPDAGFGPDRENQRRETVFNRLRREGRLLPLRQLVTLTEVPDGKLSMAEPMYAQSYTLFTYLFRNEPVALAAFIQDLTGERPGALTPERQLEIFVSRFGDPERIERQMLQR